ncbi:MAG: histidine phosphatase family protein [Rhizobiaceae bacterium]
MARTLLLLRHAKSSWTDQSLGDFERPLAKRGRKAAPLVGREMAKRGWVPNLALVSGARRTRQTWAFVAAELPAKPAVQFSDALFHAEPDTLLEIIRSVPRSCASVMVVGHNPGLEELAQMLAGPRSSAVALASLKEKFPTGALVRFAVDRPWSELATAGPTLTEFLRPRDLD